LPKLSQLVSSVLNLEAVAGGSVEVSLVAREIEAMVQAKEGAAAEAGSQGFQGC